MKKKILKQNTGFAILFAVTLSAIVLGIALGITNIAQKELKFATSAKATNEAFFAADTGIECALINDKSGTSVFKDGGPGSLSCLGVSITLNGSSPSWDFIVPNLGTSGQSCSKVSLFKNESGGIITTTIIAKGYDTGGSSGCTPSSNTVERQLESTYKTSSASAPIPAGNAASFITNDTKTIGTWPGVYGTDGYNVFGGTQSYPSYATVVSSGNAGYVWADPTSDERGLYKDNSGRSDRIAATWYSGTSYTLDVNLTDGASHQVAVYMVDWDSYGGTRQATVEVLDADTGDVLDTQALSDYTGGNYLVWNASGHIIFRFSNNGSVNVVTSGIFFN